MTHEEVKSEVLAGAARPGYLYVMNEAGTFDRLRLVRPPAVRSAHVYDDQRAEWVPVAVSMRET